MELFVDSGEQLIKALGLKKKDLGMLVRDGKELRGSGRLAETVKAIRNLQILNVYDHPTDVCLHSILIEEKHNEIPHAQEVLEGMELKDTVVLADTLHAQQKTVAKITKQHGDFIIGLKENHPLKYDCAEQLFNEKSREKMEQKGTGYLSTVEKARNRVEVRKYYVKKLPKVLSEEFKGWDGVKALVCVDTVCTDTVQDKVSKEIRYFISSITDISLASQLIRGEWNVENRLHWLLDTVMNEDDNQTVDRNAARNMSIIRKMCLGLYKLMNSVLGNGSVKGTRKMFAWDFEDSLAKLFTLMDAKTLKKALKLPN